MSVGNRQAGAWVAVLLILVAAALPCRAADRASAERALLQGRADEAAASLRSWLGTHPEDGEAHLLLCRVFYSEVQVDQAVSECEAAVRSLGNRSDAQDWMGRAYGLKADRSGPLTGFSLARKVKAAFEQAVAADSKNAAAVNDLSEYYLAAPGVVGGGADKAMDLASKVESQLPQSAHRIRAMAAEKHRDFGTAEREFRAAVGVGGRAEAWSDLGGFYVRRGQADKAVDALQHCLSAARGSDAMVDAASLLNDLHRELPLAERTLRAYLESPARTDAAPAFKVHVLLGKMLSAEGDKAGAKMEFRKALDLARDYAPAQKALQASN